MVRTPGINPPRTCGLEVGQAFPDGTSDRQLRQWLQRSHGVHLVNDEPKTIAQIDDGSINGPPGRRIENQTYRIFLTANTERMNFKCGPGFSDRFTNLQHMRTQNQMPI